MATFSRSARPLAPGPAANSAPAIKGTGGCRKSPRGKRDRSRPYKNPSAIRLRKALKINGSDAWVEGVQKYLILYETIPSICCAHRGGIENAESKTRSAVRQG